MYDDKATANPPLHVIPPPPLGPVASVEDPMLSPPVTTSAPVPTAVDAAALPIYADIPTANPPDVVILPPEIELVASVGHVMPSPPDKSTPPVDGLVVAPPCWKCACCPTQNELVMLAPPSTMRVPAVATPVASRPAARRRAPDIITEAVVPVNAVVFSKRTMPAVYKAPLTAIPPAVVKLPPLVVLVASVVHAILSPPESNTDPRISEVLDVALVKETTPAAFNTFPTYNDSFTAIPPAVVKLPPLVMDVASLVQVIPIPPVTNKDPKLEDVLAVESVQCTTPPTYNDCPIPIPPAVVKDPPALEDVASIVQSLVMVPVVEERRRLPNEMVTLPPVNVALLPTVRVCPTNKD